MRGNIKGQLFLAAHIKFKLSYWVLTPEYLKTHTNDF